MNRGRLLTLVAAVASLLAVAGVAVAGGVGEAKTATAAFHDLDQARAAGYTVTVADAAGITCIAQPGAGTMGVHMLNPALLDAKVEEGSPELLVYAPRNNGELKLVALEYLVFKADWEAAGNTSPPSLFGQEFMLTPAGNRYGLPPFYALHAWIWNSNPSGLFAAWNPSVSC